MLSGSPLAGTGAARAKKGHADAGWCLCCLNARLRRPLPPRREASL